MCGIAGIVTFGEAPGPTADLVRGMCDTLVHRGPDDEGVSIEGSVGLGMRRLSIIDVESGRQPFANEDATVSAVFNGEIYNYRELRRDLAARGHRFASETDGEVIVHLWEEHGPDFVQHLNGMFAIALHDARQRRLVLVRDRLGIKPLFWARPRDHLVFGSEIKAILASGLVDREVDLDALGEFLAWEYVPAPGTLFRTVRKLAAGEIMEVDLARGETTIRPYWDLPAPGAIGTEPAAAWIERVDQTIAECVRRQMVSDVPLGAFLSGGVDSSLVVAAMGEAKTFSIGFDDPSYNELAWSKAVARHLNVDHVVYVIRPNAVELFEQLMQFMDDPIGDFSIFPTYLVSRLAREHVTVALSGDGGDELFGGYETYVAHRQSRLWRTIPGPVRRGVIEPWLRRVRPRARKKGLVNKAKRFAEGMRHDARLRHARWRLFVGEALRRELLTPDALARAERPPTDHVLDLFERSGERAELDRCLYVDAKSYLTDNCLVKVDRMSMACSLEARVPLLDHELAELACRVPPALKVRGGTTKVLLKAVAARHVPRRCVYRPKEGFSIPIKQWLATDFGPLMEDLLSGARLEAEGIFRRETVERLKARHLAGRENNSHVLWALMVFQDWRRRWAA